MSRERFELSLSASTVPLPIGLPGQFKGKSRFFFVSETKETKMKPKVPPLVKSCNKCGNTEPHLWVQSSQSFRHDCQKCHNEYNRQYRKSHLKQERIYRSKYTREAKRKMKAFLVSLLGGQCKHCGLQDDCLAVYDFHHRDPSQKDLNISYFLNRDKDTLLREVQKCDLLCSNCHRRLHDKIRRSR